MSMLKPDRPRTHGRPPMVEACDYAGWQHGSHVWWYIDANNWTTPGDRKVHGVVVLCTRPTQYGEGPWIDIVWDDGGVIGAVPTMMTTLALRAGWQILSPSPAPRNGDA